MGKFLKRTYAIAATGALVVSLAACGGGSDDDGSSGTNDSGAQKGGTITLLDIPADYEGADPASIYYGHQIAEFRRLVYRTLVALPFDKDPKVSGTPVPDLATDTGTTPDNGKTWTFTLKDGIKWEDGKDITCEDFAYGLSRSFDDTLVNGTGPGTAYVSILNIPKVEDADGNKVPDYKGPFQSTPEQQAAYDKAVSCDGKTITYTFDQAWPDFPLSVASLLVTDPYRKDWDQGSKNLWKIYSNGPYKVDGNTFDSDKGVTFVRNDNYDAATDDPTLRESNPDEFKIELLQNPEAIFDRLVADSGDDQTAFASTNIPASFYSQIEGPVADRTLKVASPYTRFLQINHERVKDPKVRLAMVTALNREGGLKVLGGDNYGEPASTIVSASTPGYQANASFEAIPGAGDPDAAKQLLKDAGAAGYPLKVSYGQTDQNDKLFAVFKESWEAAGFKVTLNAIPEDANPGYYGQMSAKDKDTDVFYAGWASDWPSLLSVIPIVLETNNPGFNYGYYSNPDVDALIAKGREAAASGDNDGMISDLQQADALAGEDAAYVPFLQQKNYFIYGSKIGGFLPTVATSFYPDLGPIYVK
jgi:peptide/nickel transport system substrate-binding protein